MSNKVGICSGDAGPCAGREGGGGSKQLEILPDSVIEEILQRLDLYSLCSTASVSSSLRSIVSQILSSLSSIDLSGFSPDAETLDHVFYRLRDVKSVTVDCLRLRNSAIIKILGPNIQELHLLKGSSLSYYVLTSIAKRCPNLRVLALELKRQQLHKVLSKSLAEILKNRFSLESLSIKVRETDLDVFDLESIDLVFPKSLKFLKLQLISERDAIHLMHQLSDGENTSGATSSFSIPSSHPHPHSGLQHLSLVLDVISDELVISIVNSLPFLVELNLEDRTCMEPVMHDLTNNGIQSLRSCRHLSTLSIVRNRFNYPASFKRVNDLGLFLLSENCSGLESLSLGGFSKVTDAGFSSILHSCKNLKKFEVRNASLFSDLALNNIASSAGSLVELKLLYCNLITSDAVEPLASCNMLEVLDLCGCRSISDTCISYLACFTKLMTLNLGGADVTNSSLFLLGNGSSPIARLSLRGCKRITDEGISLLLLGKGTIKKTLLSLDVGHMPGISDKGISTIASAALAVTELCMRNCFFVMGSSLEALGSQRRLVDGNRSLEKLDIYNCPGLSFELVGCLQKPSFRNLRWLGAGLTTLTCKKDELDLICNERPWLTLCFEGCEFGCHDGWEYH